MAKLVIELGPLMSEARYCTQCGFAGEGHVGRFWLAITEFHREFVKVDWWTTCALGLPPFLNAETAGTIAASSPGDYAPHSLG